MSNLYDEVHSLNALADQWESMTEEQKLQYLRDISIARRRFNEMTVRQQELNTLGLDRSIAIAESGVNKK